jgi:hypothetical protein
MRRALVVFLLTAAALAGAAPGAGAAGARHGFVFSFKADGFFVEGRSALGSDGMRLFVERHGEVAYYYVKAQVAAGTARARLGRLGSLDLRFRPGRGEGPLGCGGWQRGAFVGSFAFRGENDYADIDVDRAPGWFQTRPAERCGGRSTPGRDRSARASRLAPVAETGALLYGRTAAHVPLRIFYFLTENRQAGVRVLVEAFRDERREGMLIERGDQVYGGAATFEWDLGAGTARVEPPAPFTGRAFYRASAGGGPPSWTGSLRAPIFGAKPMRLTGAEFAPRLRPAR